MKGCRLVLVVAVDLDLAMIEVDFLFRENLCFVSWVDFLAHSRYRIHLYGGHSIWLPVADSRL